MNRIKRWMLFQIESIWFGPDEATARWNRRSNPLPKSEGV
jgi:hypothetical protein